MTEILLICMVLVYSVLRCILFVSAFERDSGQTAGQIGGVRLRRIDEVGNVA